MNTSYIWQLFSCAYTGEIVHEYILYISMTVRWKENIRINTSLLSNIVPAYCVLVIHDIPTDKFGKTGIIALRSSVAHFTVLLWIFEHANRQLYEIIEAALASHDDFSRLNHR